MSDAKGEAKAAASAPRTSGEEPQVAAKPTDRSTSTPDRQPARTPASAKDSVSKPGPAAPPSPARKHAAVVALPGNAQLRSPRKAHPRTRHWLVIGSFVASVVAPTITVLLYMYAYAADQYASRVAFSIRSSENSAPVEFLGSLTSGLSNTGGADAEIVYELIRSQQMVEAAERALPLVEIYNKPEHDVVFRLGRDQPIEDVLSYWQWMTDVAFDSTSGIVHFEARAFDPDDARRITQFVLDESTRVVNELSVQAREDAVSVAREVVAETEERLRDVRRKLRAFRDIEQELDPSENARASLGLIATLEADLARTEIELDTQRALIGETGPRTQLLEQKIRSLRTRIAEERGRIGAGVGITSDQERAYSDLVAEYEELVVDREFAENAYMSSLNSFEQAQIEARRQMRYLSPHIEPTLSVEPQYPQRLLLTAGISGILLVLWAVAVLVVYNIHDRR